MFTPRAARYVFAIPPCNLPPSFDAQLRPECHDTTFTYLPTYPPTYRGMSRPYVASAGQAIA